MPAGDGEAALWTGQGKEHCLQGPEDRGVSIVWRTRIPLRHGAFSPLRPVGQTAFSWGFPRNRRRTPCRRVSVCRVARVQTGGGLHSLCSAEPGWMDASSPECSRRGGRRTPSTDDVGHRHQRLGTLSGLGPARNRSRDPSGNGSVPSSTPEGDRHRPEGYRRQSFQSRGGRKAEPEAAVRAGRPPSRTRASLIIFPRYSLPCEIPLSIVERTRR